MEEWQLQQKQSLPLNIKISMTKRRVTEWYHKYNGMVYISYSGGKDSEVLLHIVKELFPDVPIVFIDNGVEETRLHALKKAEVIMYPKKPILKIWKEDGLPFPSKQQANYIRKVKHTNSDYLRSRLLTGIMKDGSKTMFKLSKKWLPIVKSNIEVSDRCCWYLKKEPFKRYNKESGRKPFIGNMATDGMERKKQYKQHGCFNLDKEQCMPLGFWTEQDVLQYIITFNLDYAKEQYGDIIKINGLLKTTKAKRTGCFPCGFGVHLEKEPNRFQRMEEENPRLHNIILHKWVDGAMGKLLDLCNVNYNKPKVIQCTLSQNNKKEVTGFLPQINLWVSALRFYHNFVL